MRLFWYIIEFATFIHIARNHTNETVNTINNTNRLIWLVTICIEQKNRFQSFYPRCILHRYVHYNFVSNKLLFLRKINNNFFLKMWLILCIERNFHRLIFLLSTNIKATHIFHTWNESHTLHINLHSSTFLTVLNDLNHFFVNYFFFVNLFCKLTFHVYTNLQCTFFFISLVSNEIIAIQKKCFVFLSNSFVYLTAHSERYQPSMYECQLAIQNWDKKLYPSNVGLSNTHTYNTHQVELFWSGNNMCVDCWTVLLVSYFFFLTEKRLRKAFRFILYVWKMLKVMGSVIYTFSHVDWISIHQHPQWRGKKTHSRRISYIMKMCGLMFDSCLCVMIKISNVSSKKPFSHFHPKIDNNELSEIVCIWHVKGI